MSSNARGWAVQTPDQIIDMKTIADSRTAAIVNWLACRKNVQVTRFHEPDNIEKLWIIHSKKEKLVEVTVSLAPTVVLP